MKERLKELRRHLRLSQASLAKELGIKQSSYATYEVRGTRLPADLLTILMRKYAVNPDWLMFGKGNMIFKDDDFLYFYTGLRVSPTDKVGTNILAQDPDTATLPVLDIRAGAGPGIENFHEAEVGRYKITRQLLHPYDKMIDKAHLIQVAGDSMNGGKAPIKDGDWMVIIEGLINAEGGVYLINLNGSLRIKRLQFLVDGSVKLISDNTAYEPELIPAEIVEAKESFRIIGKAVKRLSDV